MTLRVVPRNSHALRLYETIGFVEEGRLLNQIRHDDGTYHDLASMAIYVKENIAPPGFREWPRSR